MSMQVSHVAAESIVAKRSRTVAENEYVDILNVAYSDYQSGRVWCGVAESQEERKEFVKKITSAKPTWARHNTDKQGKFEVATDNGNKLSVVLVWTPALT